MPVQEKHSVHIQVQCHPRLWVSTGVLDMSSVDKEGCYRALNLWFVLIVGYDYYLLI